MQQPRSIKGPSAHRGPCLALLLLALFWAHDAVAENWTEVRDMIRSADRLGKTVQSKKSYRSAYEKAAAGVARPSAGSNDYLWLAIAAGRVAQVADTREKIALSKVVKENAEKAIALDKNNGAAYATLGGWHFYVADISWVERNAAKLIYGSLPTASYEKAVELLSKALTLGVDNSMEVYYIRGLAYDELDDDPKAEADFRKVLSIPATTAREKELHAEAKDELD